MTEATGEGQSLQREGGVALIAGAIASIVLMMNHPSGPHGGAAVPGVHGGMMIALGAMLFGFISFALRRGARTAIIFGLIAYGTSFAAHIAAATINGFAVASMASWPSGAPGHDVFLFAWVLNQALAGLGIFGTGIAYCCWAFDLRRDQPIVAAVGALAGIIPASLLAFGVIRLDVHGALLAYGLHGLWALMFGVTMWRASRSG